MDENVKNDAKQVMLVQNADDGRLQAVTGVDRDGNIQTTDPTDQNVASLLNVNTQDSALEAFFKKFMEQAQNPVHTGIFVNDGECPETNLSASTSTRRSWKITVSTPPNGSRRRSSGSSSRWTSRR